MLFLAENFVLGGGMMVGVVWKGLPVVVGSDFFKFFFCSL